MNVVPIVFCIIASGIEPIEFISLDTGGLSLETVPHPRLRVARDRSLLYAESRYLWHWDPSGRLLGKIGVPAGEAGSVDNLGSYYWDGQHYWLVDSLKLSSTVYDKNGKFLAHDDVYARQFLELEGQLFITDPSGAEKKLYPPLLKEIRLRIEKDRVKLKYSGLSFCKVSHRQLTFMNFNFKQVWLTRQGDTYFVANQLEPKIMVYDHLTREREAAVSLEEAFAPPVIPLQLTEYVLPPERFVHTGDTSRWYHGWSRINGLHRSKTGFLVGYETPDAQNPRASLQVVQEVTPEGRETGRLVLVEGHLMGFRGNQAYIFTELAGDTRAYVVKVFKFP